MRLRRVLWLALLLAPIVLSTQALPAQSAPANAVQTPEQQLRAEFLFNNLQDSTEAMAEAKDATLATRAWFVAMAVRDSGNTVFAPALTVLDGMIKDSPDSGWTIAARSWVSNGPEETLYFCEKAVAKDANPDILLLCTRAIGAKTEKPEDVQFLKGFIEKHRDRLESTPEGLVFEGNALGRIAWVVDHKRFNDQSTPLYDRALQLAPENEYVMFAKLHDLNQRKQYKEAVAMFEHSPVFLHDTETHVGYYDALANLTEVKKEERAKRIEADGRKFIEQVEPNERFVHFLLEDLGKPTKAQKDSIYDLVIHTYPKSDISEWSRLQRISGDYDDDQSTPEQRKRLAPLLVAYLQESGSRASRDAVWTLSELARHGDVTDDQLFQAVQSLPPESAGVLIELLADHKSHLPELESIAAEQVEKSIRETSVRTTLWHYDLTAMDATGQKITWMGPAYWEGLLGWIYLQEGRTKDAELKLLTAEHILDVEWGSFPGKMIDHRLELLAYLGRLYTAKGDYAKAESYLSRSMGAEYDGPDDHPAIAGYKELYFKQHGGNDGLDKYMEIATAKERERRKEKILKDRIKDPKPIPAFKLTTIDGKTISSDSLKGKIVIVNFWGTWCGPCKFELPELQKFYEKYKNDPNVVYLTVDARDTPETVKNFMTEKKYTFPVLMEGEYTSTAQINGFPTTWFIDKEGRKVFEKVGSSRRVVEEFTWRVEGMMESPANDSGATKTP